MIGKNKENMKSSDNINKHIHDVSANVRGLIKRLHLDNGHQALVSGWISGYREPAGGVAPSDFVDSVPGRRVGLVLVSHRQVGHNDIHAVFTHHAGKLHE